METRSRTSHFLGTKLKALRKQHRITLDDLSARCAQIDPRLAPSVSYLSMIESGQRTPSEPLLKLLGQVLQRGADWFMDGNAEWTPPVGRAASSAAGALPFEPAFLFSKPLLQSAIPELLAQTGITGRQFAHLLIRSHQELSRNEYPELERAAEQVGKRAFPLGAEDLLALCRHHGLEIRWFDHAPVLAKDNEREVKSVVRSFFKAPNIIYINKALQQDVARMKFDLASHIGHKVLHDGDGLKSLHATGGEMGESPDSGTPLAAGVDARDVLLAWRDFECSFFAGALLCPKLPFRRFLVKERHRVQSAKKLDLTAAVIMRRMTKVSQYPYWHFFDSDAPGRFRAVYRGNGIPLPWGSLNQAQDPCPNWAVFRIPEKPGHSSSSQISALHDESGWRLYCCHTLRSRDLAGNQHVLSVGLDLGPAMTAHGLDEAGIIRSIAEDCRGHGGEVHISGDAAEAVRTVARVLSIAWVEDALEQPARIICPRHAHCPRSPVCSGTASTRARDVNDVKEEILQGRR
jgi:hypothetical protein